MRRASYSYYRMWELQFEKNVRFSYIYCIVFIFVEYIDFIRIDVASRCRTGAKNVTQRKANQPEFSFRN